jgi:seryl-tRNA synthetase
MLQLKYIRDNKEDVLKRLSIKNFENAEEVINRIIDLDIKRRNIQKEREVIKAEANRLAKEIGKKKKEKE